jgi:hexosaminidase
MEGEPTDKILYSLDGSEPGISSSVYQGPFLLKQKTNISAKAMINNILSESIASKEIILSKATYRPINYLTNYNTTISGNG